MLYLINISLIFILLIYLKTHHYKTEKVEQLIIILLILFAGLQLNFSDDYQSYRGLFSEINSIKDVINTILEPGFAVLIFTFKKIGLGFNTFLLFIAFCSITLKKKAIKKLSSLPYLSLLLYFLLYYITQDVIQIRQGLAIAVCFYAIIFVTEKNPFAFFGAVFIAITFHYSAIIFLPVYFLKNINLKNKRLILFLVFISLLISSVNILSIINWVNTSFLHSSYIFHKLKIYDTVSISIISVTFIIRLLIYIFYIFFTDNDNQNKLYANIYLLGIFIFSMFHSVEILAARFTIYFRFIEILMIPDIYKSARKCENKSKKIMMYTFLLFMLFYYILKFVLVLIDPNYLFYQSI